MNFVGENSHNLSFKPFEHYFELAHDFRWTFEQVRLLLLLLVHFRELSACAK